MTSKTAVIVIVLMVARPAVDYQEVANPGMRVQLRMPRRLIRLTLGLRLWLFGRWKPQW